MKITRLKISLLAIIILACSACGILVVQPDEVAVVINILSGELEEPLFGGTHFVGLFQRVATIYSFRQQELSMFVYFQDGEEHTEDAVDALTSDGQTVLLDVTVLYAIDPVTVNQLYLHWENQYATGFVRPISRNTIREVIATYPAEDIYDQTRFEVEIAIKDRLRERMAEEGLILRDLLVRNVVFTPEFTATIEAHLLATQNANP